MLQGTWQYMSVALLNNPSKVVEIADDLEAHFYVLLYHAVRYLRSNCTNVPNWIEDFFDVFEHMLKDAEGVTEVSVRRVLL